MLGKGHDGLYKAPTKEERRKQKAKRGERSDDVKMAQAQSKRSVAYII